MMVPMMAGDEHRNHSITDFRSASSSAERLLKVGDDVLHRLDADRYPHQVVANPQALAMLGRKIAMRRHGWIEDQRVHVAEGGRAHHHFQFLHEAKNFRASCSLQFE